MYRKSAISFAFLAWGLVFCLTSTPRAVLAVVINNADLELVEEEYGPKGRSRVAQWASLIARDKADTRLADFVKIARANEYFNRVPWLQDIDHWGVEDYWATPIETLASNGGDCEDYSIGKYFSLLAVDFDAKKLRITYVKSLTYDQAHMVLTYYETPESEPLVLDNINGEILPASKRPDLLPIYSFDAESIWLAKERGRKLNGSSQTSLPRWQALYQRMQKYR